MRHFIKKVYLFFRRKYWYLFPIPVVSFFIKEWREEKLYLMTLDDQEKQEVRRRKISYFVSFSLSLVLHIVFFLGVLNGVFSRVLSGKDMVVDKSIVNFDVLTEGMVSTYLDPVYDQDSDIIVDPAFLGKRKKERDKQILVLDNLLSELKNSGDPVPSSSFSKERKQTLGFHREKRRLKAGLGKMRHRKGTSKKMAPMRVQLWDRMSLSNSNKISSNVDYTHIMKVIDQYSFQFRDCYERALLKDEHLSVKAAFLLQLNQSKVEKTKLELHGNGNPRSHRILSRCLFQKSKNLVFSKNEKNISIKFSLIFGI